MSSENGNGNGHSNGNGHGNSGDVRLQKLLAYHEGIAAAIRTTLAALNGLATVNKAAKSSGLTGILAEALALDGERRGVVGTRGARGSSARAKVHAFLEQFAPGDVIPQERARRMGALVLHGYLRHDDKGQYIRTAKPHTVHQASARQQQHARGAAVVEVPTGTGKKRNPQIAAVLNSLKPREELPDGTIKYGRGVLLHHGYLRKNKAGAYIRTAKPYPEA